MCWLMNRWLLLNCVLIFTFKDCQCFFLRNAQSGKCIKASDTLVYSDERHLALPYWAVMTEDCLHPRAQFRYLDTGLVQNIATGGNFHYATDKRYKSRLAVYKGESLDARKWSQNNATQSLIQTATRFLSFDKKKVCALPAEYYVNITNKCNSKNKQKYQKFTFGSVTDHNAKMEDVHCSPKQVMVVKTANSGDFDKSGVFNRKPTIDKTCSMLTNCQVKSRCNGNRSCELTVDNTLLPPDYCSDTSNKIYTKYKCVDSYKSTSITTGENIRLSHASSGFIEIKNDSKWKKVYEKNWEEKHEQTLCQHLGFKTHPNGIGRQTRGLGSYRYDIATGDLLCYNTGSEETSCCINLEASTNNQNIKYPYVRCKVCDNPILRDHSSKYPEFSGSGGHKNYQQASFYQRGWCSFDKARSAHLLITLPAQYRITKVVTMGNRAQTRWGQSYLLKYGHNENLEDKKKTITIIGNKNGYKASISPVDIYNVRYLKIESTSKTAFCLRVLLCGDVQSPAAVENVISQTWSSSARLSWTIPNNRSFSFITKFKIYYKGNTWKDITRKENQNSDFAVLNKLKPDTPYTVNIYTHDGSRYSKPIRVHFTTKQGVPTGPPENIGFISRGKDWLKLSWNAPNKNLRNGVVTKYRICYSTQVRDNKQNCKTTLITTNLRHKTNLKHTYKIERLQSSTKYVVTLSAGTKTGFGISSSEISQITNGEPVKLVAESYSSLSFKVPMKRTKYIKQIMVIVKIATRKGQRSEEIKTKNLRPYNRKKHTKPYITGILEPPDIPLSSTFVIGDGSESRDRKYFNQPLQQNTYYIVFLRFIEKESFYSTEWSTSVKTMIKPSAPEISKLISSGRKTYTVSWSQPLLPEGQTVQKYHVTYYQQGSSNRLFNETTSINVTIRVEYDLQYTFEVQVETKAGKSDNAKKSWLSHSEPLKPPKKIENGYTIKLRRPRNGKKIRTVALVLLQVESHSSKPPAPEEITELSKLPPADEQKTNVAFIAYELNRTEFQSDTIEILLQGSKKKQRRKRETIKSGVELTADAIYRAAQMNTDEYGSQSWSYWSKPFTFTKVKGNKDDDENNGDNGPSDDGGENGNGDKTNDGSKKEHLDGESSGGSVGAIVGASVGGTVIVVTVLVLVVIFLRRRIIHKRSSKNKTASNENGDEMQEINDDGNGGRDGQPINRIECINSNTETGYVEEKGHPPVPVAEFACYVNKMKANDNQEFEIEFDDLPKILDTSWEVAKQAFNKNKNRYANIVTYDHSRVVLSGDKEEDYINASYIDGMSTNSYIATQGPNKLTVNDIWRMVWERRSYSIVMVTSLVELGKHKCERYWPDQGSEMYGDIEVTLMRTEEFAYYVTRTLQLKKDKEEREVRHYFFSSWPDHGVPKCPTQLLTFRRHFRVYHLEETGPVVVHCSAGVGRTGVFIAIDSVLEKLEKGVIDSIDVFGQVSTMRERRMNMVQTLEQYIFVHEAILETILCGINEVDSTKIQKEIEKLSTVRASGMTGFQEKFKRLDEVSPTLSPEECTAALLEGNRKKTRNISVLPAECNRVSLQYVEGVENSDYINAVFVHGYLGKNYFIATQSPLPNTINDFWRMVYLQNSSTIVLLNNVKAGTSFPKFWPTSRGIPMQYENLTVQLDSETQSDAVWTRTFIVSPYPDLTDGRVVNIFQCTTWPDHHVPASPGDIITLTSLVEKSRQRHGQGPIVVACSDGAGRTGTFIAISNLLERMKTEQAVDVFQAIKIIRGTRPQFVENAVQYQFCYTAMMEYLERFSDYANFE